MSRPTTVAVTSTLRARGHWHMKVGLNVMIGSSSCGCSTGAWWLPVRERRRLRSWRTVMRPATTSISAEKAARSTGSGTADDRCAPATAPPIATAPNAIPRASSTLPARRAVTAPAREVTPDDDERSGGRLRGGLAEREEHGDGQDGAAAAERTQAEPDERSGDDGEEELDHASGPTRWRPTCSALSKESSIATSERPAASSIEAATDAR